MDLATLNSCNGGSIIQLLTCFLFLLFVLCVSHLLRYVLKTHCVWFVCLLCGCVLPGSLLSHARLRCMCTCNRCTFCLCQNFLNSELLQTVRAKLYAVVLRRSSFRTSLYLCDMSPSPRCAAFQSLLIFHSAI